MTYKVYKSGESLPEDELFIADFTDHPYKGCPCYITQDEEGNLMYIFFRDGNAHLNTYTDAVLSMEVLRKITALLQKVTFNKLIE